MANLMRNRFSKQFYDGKAWNTPPGQDYSDRRNKIEEEINEAINYMRNLQVVKDIGELNTGFIKKIITAINQSLKRERVLYEALDLEDYPKQVNINNIDSLKERMKTISEMITQYFNPADSDKIMFLSLLNNKNFLSQVISEQTTQLSYTVLGKSKKGDRNTGKTLATSALSNAMKSGLTKENRYNLLKSILQFDFNEYFVEYSKKNDLSEQLGKNTHALINQLITEVLNKHFANSGLMKIANKKRMSDLLKTTNEQNVKAFYKDLYRTFEQNFIGVGKTIAQKNAEISKRREQKYFAGSLVLAEKIEDTPYGEEILMTFYSKNSVVNKSGNKLGDRDINLKYDDFLNIFIDFLQKQIEIFVSSNPEYSPALRYIKDKKIRTKIFNVLKRAYVKGETDGDKIANFMQFSKSNVSGLFGEIGAAISFSIGTNRAIISGSDKNKLGQKISTDVKLTIYNKKKGDAASTKHLIGIQVKNYTSSDNVSLYGNTEIGFDNNTLSRYLPKKDLRVLLFLAANMKFINDKGIDSLTKKDLQDFLYAYFPNFLRIADLKEDVTEDTTQNSFYYINNKIFSASYILALMLDNIKNVLSNANKERTLFIINGKFPKYDAIDPEIKGHSYHNLSQAKVRQQPYAQKIGPNGFEIAPAHGFIGPDGRTYPNDVNGNLLSDLKIKFKGVTVKIF